MFQKKDLSLTRARRPPMKRSSFSWVNRLEGVGANCGGKDVFIGPKEERAFWTVRRKGNVWRLRDDKGKGWRIRWKKVMNGLVHEREKQFIAVT